jgi:hypothetical protein
MATTFEERLTALQAAKAQADTKFLTAVNTAKDAYVQAGRDHVEAETAWMNSPVDNALKAAADGTWQVVQTARDEMLTAMSEADTTRQDTLDEAWTTITGD